MEEEPWLPCLRFTGAPGYHFGLAIGKRFGPMIRSRFASDPALHSELLPFAATKDGEALISALTATNKCETLNPNPLKTTFISEPAPCSSCRQQFPTYFDELQGTADGAEVPFLQVSTLSPKPSTPRFSYIVSILLHPTHI